MNGIEVYLMCEEAAVMTMIRDVNGSAHRAGREMGLRGLPAEAAGKAA